jgi:hypothetical protein
MDPVSLSASIAGLLSLSIEITKPLNEYITGVKSAPTEAQSLLNEIMALNSVLEQLTKFLQSEDAKGIAFDQTSALRTVIAFC